jgi:hypothetical protein
MHVSWKFCVDFNSCWPDLRNNAFDMQKENLVSSVDEVSDCITKNAVLFVLKNKCFSRRFA